MKIVFNSKRENAACTIFYHDALTRMPEITVNDFDNYSDYDVALFMTYAEDLEELKKAKQSNPKLITAIIDPRSEAVMQYVEYADFLVIDSLEMRDYWTKAKLPIFEYVEYPDLNIIEKIHRDKDKIVIGYHGNVIHLNCMAEVISPALDELSNDFSIEFQAIYNIEAQGKWLHGLPNKVKVKHIQWYEDVYENEMTEFDIGIVPAFMPTIDTVKYEKSTKRHWWKSAKKGVSFNFAKDDYLVRYKMPSNPGRIIVFGLVGIPVVADFFPSAMSVIEDGKNGLLAASQHGWQYALGKLIKSHKLRQEFSDSMQDKLKVKYNFDIQNNNFRKFLNTEILG